MPLYFALVLAAGVGIGYYFTFNTELSLKNASFHSKTKGNKINNLLDYIEMQYVDTVNREQLENKCVDQGNKSRFECCGQSPGYSLEGSFNGGHVTGTLKCESKRPDCLAESENRSDESQHRYRPDETSQQAVA